MFAGPVALAHLRERGLRAADVRVIPAAAGGAKGLVLNPLDRFLFGHWLPAGRPVDAPPLHLLGASIGAWRMVCAMLHDADAALAQLAHSYIHQQFRVPEGGWPDATEVSRVFAELLGQQFGGREAALLAHPQYRLHVFTSRGRGLLLRREGPLRTPLGYAGAFATNLARRRAAGCGGWCSPIRVMHCRCRCMISTRAVCRWIPATWARRCRPAARSRLY